MEADTTAPAGSLNINSGAAAVNTTAVTLNLSATDAVGVTGYRVANGSDASGATTVNVTSKTSYSANISFTLTSGEGTKTVAVQYRDAAGNWSDNYTDTIIYDTTAPAGSLNINSGAVATKTRSVTLNLSATDAVGVTGYRVANGTSASGATTVNVTSTTSYSADISFTLSTGNGTKTVAVQYRDAAGNWSDNYTDTIILDAVVPTISLAAYAPDPTTDNTPSYNGTAADTLTDIVDIEYRIDSGGTWTDVDSFTPGLSVSFTFTTSDLTDGNHTIYVRAYDAVGNVSTTPSDTLTVDTTAPAGSLNINSGAAAVNTTAVTLNLSATDAVGVTGYRVANGSDASGATTVNVTSTTSYSANISFTLSTGEGTKTVAVQYRDAAGNWSTTVSDALTVGTSPTITSQPSSATKIIGESVTFSVTASGTVPLGYQWRKGGTIIPGATSSSHTIQSVAPGDTGSYDVVVNNAFGSVTSNSVTLTIIKIVTIVSVTSATGTYGGTVNLSATLTSGGLGVIGKTINFTLNGVGVGIAVTNSSGIATLTDVSLSGIDAGSYPTGFGASFAGDSNYDSSNGTASLTITPAPLTTTAVRNSPAGSYTVTPGGLSSDNYSKTFVNRILNIIANDKSKVSGAPLTASYSNSVLGYNETELTGTILFAYNTSGSSSIGPYATIPDGLSSDNYRITFINGILNIIPVPIPSIEPAAPLIIITSTTSLQAIGMVTFKGLNSFIPVSGASALIVGIIVLVLSIIRKRPESYKYV